MWLEGGGFGNLVDDLTLILEVNCGAAEELAHLRVGEDLLDLLNVRAGGVEGVVGLGDVGQGGGVAGGCCGHHPGTKGGTGAEELLVVGGGEFEGENGRGEGKVEGLMEERGSWRLGRGYDFGLGGDWNLSESRHSCLASELQPKTRDTEGERAGVLLLVKVWIFLSCPSEE